MPVGVKTRFFAVRTMNRIAESIKESVTMKDVLLHYGFPTGRNGRIPCPLHNGHDPNFSYKDRYFKCFVCGKGGDMIRFVMELFDITFPQAITRISADFGLGLCGDRPSTAARPKLLEERRERQKELEALDEQRRALLEDFRYYFEICKYFTPVRDGWNAYFSPLWVEAQQKLPALEYQIDELDERIRTLKGW